VRSSAVDVSNLDDVRRPKASVYEAFDEVAVLMDNAGSGGGQGSYLATRLVDDASGARSTGSRPSLRT
jgi:hypothetical protein